MTYYELVNYLVDISLKPIDNKNIEFLNSIDINLEGERYQRFLLKLETILADRLANAITKLKDKILTEGFDINTLTIETSLIRSEVKYCLDISRCLLVKPENQKEFVKSIVETNNSLIDTLLTIFDGDDRQNILKGAYLKEETI